MGAGDRAHEEDDPQNHQPRRDHRCRKAYLTLAVQDAPTRGDQHQHERAQQLGKEPAPLQARIIEVLAVAELQHQQVMRAGHERHDLCRETRSRACARRDLGGSLTRTVGHESFSFMHPPIGRIHTRSCKRQATDYRVLWGSESTAPSGCLRDRVVPALAHSTIPRQQNALAKRLDQLRMAILLGSSEAEHPRPPSRC